jgi:DNA-binding MarR family transcriptional regulator
MPLVAGAVDRVDDGRPSTEEVAVWRSFLLAHARLIRTLEAELGVAGAIPLATYDVMVQLTEAPERRLRMTELADRVLLSRSGLTRLVDRLERDGLVRREPCPDDARGMYAVLTDAGVDRLRSAARVHLPGVAEHFVRRFNRQELTRLGQLLARLAD